MCTSEFTENQYTFYLYFNYAGLTKEVDHCENVLVVCFIKFCDISVLERHVTYHLTCPWLSPSFDFHSCLNHLASATNDVV